MYVRIEEQWMDDEIQVLSKFLDVRDLNTFWIGNRQILIFVINEIIGPFGEG